MLELIKGRFRADPYENYNAVSINWGVIFVAVLIIRAWLFGVYVGALIFGISHVDDQYKKHSSAGFLHKLQNKRHTWHT